MLTTVNSLANIYLSTKVAQDLDVPNGLLLLNKAWPCSNDKMGLEYVTAGGQKMAGQWFRDLEQLDQVSHETRQSNHRSTCHVVSLPERGVLLQTGGADRKLAALGDIASQPHSQLLIHNPEKRAVVRLKVASHIYYAKLARPKRTASILDLGRRLHSFGNGHFSFPSLMEWNLKLGVTIWTEPLGPSLNDLLVRGQCLESNKQGTTFEKEHQTREERLATSSLAIGKALRAFHNTPKFQGLEKHSAEHEIALLKKMLNRLLVFAPTRYPQCLRTARKVFEGLGKSSLSSVLLHRDFYDKQVYVSELGKIGLVEFDTLGVGEAALDIANMLVHIELRALQGDCTRETALVSARAFIEGYNPEAYVLGRIGDYADATRLRLACLYSFRPQEASMVHSLLARLGKTPLGLDMDFDR